MIFYQCIDLVFSYKAFLNHKVMLSHIVMLSHTVTMVSHKSALSYQALFRVLPVVSPRTCGGCGHTPQPWQEYREYGTQLLDNIP